MKKPYGNEIKSVCRECYFYRTEACLLDVKCVYALNYNRFLRCMLPDYEKTYGSKIIKQGGEQ